MTANIKSEISELEVLENKGSLAFIAILALALGLTAILLASGHASAYQDWRPEITHTVSGTETYTNETIDATNIYVPPGSTLRLINTDLQMEDQGFIWVDGTLEVTDYDGDASTLNDRSMIYGSFGISSTFSLEVNQYGNFLLKNSDLQNCGRASIFLEERGLYIATNNATIIGSTIHYVQYNGIVVDTTGEVRIINSSIYETPQGGVSSMGEVNISGSSFDFSFNGPAVYLYGGSAKGIIKSTTFSESWGGVYADWGSYIEIANSSMFDIVEYEFYAYYASGYVNDTSMTLDYGLGQILAYITGGSFEFNNCDILDSSGYGLYLVNSMVTVKGSDVERSASDGIYAEGGDLYINDTNINDNHGNGLNLWSMNKVVISNSSVKRNWERGITCYYSNTLVIDSNNISEQPYNQAIYVVATYSVDITNNIFNKNIGGMTISETSILNINGNTMTKQQSGFSIEVYQSSGKISHNTITNQSNWAILLGSQDHLIVNNNKFDNNYRDIYWSESWVDIINNIMNGTSEESLHAEYAYTSTIVNNTFTYPQHYWIEFIDLSYSSVTLVDKNSFDGKCYWQDEQSSLGIKFDYPTAEPTITNNTFNHLEQAIIVEHTDWWSWLVNGITIKDNTFTNMGESPTVKLDLNFYQGIYDIEGNTFFNTSSTCIDIENYYSYNMQLVFENNSFTNVGGAIDYYNYYYWSGYVPPLTFKNNTLKNSYYDQPIRFQFVGDTEMADNTLFNCTGGGIQFDSLHGDVHIVGDSITESESGMSIYLYDDRTVTVKDSVYTSNQGTGFYINHPRDISFENVNASKNYHGVYIEDNQDGNLFIGNSTFDDNEYYGFHDNSIYDLKIINSDFSRNVVGMSLQNLYGTALIKGSTFDDNQQEGYYTNYVNHIEVFNSDFSNNGNGMVLYENHQGAVIKDSFFNNNENTGFHQTMVYPSQSKQTIIDHCEFNGNDWGASLYYSHFVLSNSEFKNNTRGLYMEGGWQNSLAQVHDNQFYDNNEYGLVNQMYSAASGSGVWDNDFIKNGIGIVHYTGATFTYRSNSFFMGSVGIEDYSNGQTIIKDNDFSFLSMGVLIDYDPALIEGNTFTNIWTSAIELRYVSSSTISKNEFSNCNRAVYTYDTMVNLNDNQYSGNSYGIYIEDGIAFLTNETLKGNLVGIYIGPHSFMTIEDITIENSGLYGIQSPGQNYVSIIIKKDSRIVSSPIQLTGIITIETGGKLTLESSKIVINSPGGNPYSITVKNGATLTVKDCEISAENSTRPYGFVALPGSTISLTGSTFRSVGYGTEPQGSGLYIAGHATIEGVTVDGAFNGLYITGHVDITMRNSTITNVRGQDIWIQNASILRLGNTKFDRKHVTVLDTSKIIIDRIIKVTVFDDANDPYSGVTVTVVSDGSTVGSGKTDDKGQWSSFFEGAIISKTGYTETLNNYTITLDDGLQTRNDTFVLTDDYDHVFKFGVAPVVLKGPTPLTVAEDTPLVIDLGKYFRDNDTMTYTVRGAVSLKVDIFGSMASIQGASDWFGTDSFTIVATDTHGLTSTYEITVKVTPVNDPPTISGVPNLVLEQYQDYVLDLSSYLKDPDTPLSELTITVNSQYATVHGLKVTLNYPLLTIEYVRITVRDAQGGSAQDILVSVIAGHPAPKSKGLPEYFNASEGVIDDLDLAPYIDNGGLNMSTVKITSTDPVVLKVDGTKITFQFPDGPLWRDLILIVANENGNTTFKLRFYVYPVNDAPVLADLPPVTVTEDLEYVLDLTPYISDIDTHASQLIITTNRTDIRVDGMLLIIKIKDANGLISASVKVSDGFKSATKTLRISVINVNDQPVLDRQAVSRNSGTTDQKFTFTVYLTDPDSPYPTVYTFIDGQRYSMSKVSGNVATGAQYTLTLKLKAGSHVYHFEADDGSGAANSKAWTPDVTSLKVSAPMNYMNYAPILLILVILIVVAILLLAARRKSKPEENVTDEETDETDKAFSSADEDEEAEEEDEEKDEEKDEPEEPEEATEVEPVEEEPEAAPKALKTKDSAADLKAQDAEAPSVKPRKAKDLNLPKSEDMDKVEPEKPKDASSLSEKDSESEVKGEDSDLDSLMKEITKDAPRKMKKKKVE